MFADDTTLIHTHASLDSSLLSLNNSCERLSKWCTYNRIDVNWQKTKAMFITNRRGLLLPKVINHELIEIEVVSSFRLLGVIIDNDLNFIQHVAETRIAVNKRLFSIKRLFFLSHNVRLQFFKSFILPHFDYCASLLIYFPKYSIQKLSNSFNYCLFKLFKINPLIHNNNCFNMLNNTLEQMGLQNFQHRMLTRIALFIHKIISSESAPLNLKSQLVFNSTRELNYMLRNNNQLQIPSLSKLNDFGEDTFNCFYSKFINLHLLDDLDTDYTFFKRRLINNINIHFLKFVHNFSKFDLNYKIFYVKAFSN
jgi:hypothetical protein